MSTRTSYRSLFAPICLALMLSLPGSQTLARPEPQAETDFVVIDAYVREQQIDLGIPGMALGIVRHDRIAHLQGFGVADSAGRAVTPQTPFYIGSLTKSFTALAVMQLVDAGKMNLDAPVQTYLPWFSLADEEASAGIIVRHLLNHTSGISAKDGDRFWASQQGLEETVRGFQTIQPSQPVGTTYQYSNINYGIAGLIVEAVSGLPYAQYVAQQIFEPLDMLHSYASHSLALSDGLAQSHRYIAGHPFASDGPRPPVYLPSGLLFASAEDMTHYMIAHLSEGRYGETAILSPQGMAESHTRGRLTDGGEVDYAMGWNVGSLDGSPYLGHNGALRNAWGEIFLLPETGWGLVLLANANGFEQLTQVTMVAEGVLSLLNGKSPAPVRLYLPLRFLYWMLLLAPILMILGIVLGWRAWRTKGVRHMWRVVVLYGGISLLWLLGVPPLMRQRLGSGMRVWYPELYYALIAAAALGIGWSVVHTAMNLRARRVRSGVSLDGAQ